MSIVFHETTGIFHLFNQELSYIMMILPNGHLGQLYCGRRIAGRIFPTCWSWLPETWLPILNRTIAPFRWAM